MKCACADAAVGEGLARLHRDLPQVERAQRLHGGLDVVFLADRHAAAGEDQVVAAAAATRKRLRRSRRAGPGTMPQVVHLAAQALQQGCAGRSGWSCRWRPASWPRARTSPGITSSSPVENSATRGRRATCSGPGRRWPPGRAPAGVEALALRQHRVAARDVLAAAADPLARGGHAQDAHPAARRQRSVSSCITTASAPAGIGAPVKMRAARAGLQGCGSAAGRECAG